MKHDHYFDTMSNIKVINMFYDPCHRATVSFKPRLSRQEEDDVEVSLVFQYNCVLNAWVQMSCDLEDLYSDLGIVDEFEKDDVETLYSLLDTRGNSIISQYGGGVILKFGNKNDFVAEYS